MPRRMSFAGLERLAAADVVRTGTGSSHGAISMKPQPRDGGYARLGLLESDTTRPGQGVRAERERSRAFPTREEQQEPLVTDHV